ncbi:hypothetical protein GOP47_0024684 [Adiantum capillus-veneris]|uniref:NEP1-interacting protein-like 2 n=1 Tax=Adiantum capillus-veneris TaxID=13818 RepID=A0A9D4Z3V7_ADICA|nr:hypothetical protein GOP47_0024684 [Adiantum capillus-veneris]
MGDGDFAAAAVRQGDLTAAADSLVLSTSVCNVPRLLAGALSGALTGVFAVVGAFTGAVTGALAGRATDSGLLRGAGLGAVAGAVLSVEVLEASRAYWYSEHASSRLSSSVAEFLEDLLNGRFVQNQVAPTILNVHRWQQVNISEMSYEELYDIFGPGEGSREGASKACIENLPSHIVTEKNRIDSFGEIICCTICLQDLLQGEMARQCIQRDYAAQERMPCNGSDYVVQHV